MANVKNTVLYKSCCDQTFETSAVKLTLICKEIERLINYTEEELDHMYASKSVINFQNHLKKLIHKVVGIRNEVKTAHDNISMLNVQIEAVQADINNFHMKNLKNIKVQEKKKKAELKRLRANRNRLNERHADTRPYRNNIAPSSENQAAATRSQISDIVLHLELMKSDSDADSHESFASSSWTVGSQVSQSGSLSSIIRLGFGPFVRLNNNSTTQ